MDVNKIYCGDAIQVMKEKIDNESIDLTVTSPPYDSLRDYKGYQFDYQGMIKELYRVTKKGGVVVWVVGDATIKGGETLTSFRHALAFQNIGFLCHDTMLYQKNGAAYPAGYKSNRYSQVFEYCFIFCKPTISSKILRLPSRMKIEDCTWLASAIDGEGCFRIRYNGKGGSIHININVGNTDIRYVQRCKDITGLGAITSNNKGTFHEWNIHSDDAAKVAAEIYPYLLIKKERAKVIIEAQNMMRRQSKIGRSSSLTVKEIEQRKFYFEILRSLNAKQIDTSNLPEPDLSFKITGGPKTANLLKDKPNRWAGSTIFGNHNTERTKKGNIKIRKARGEMIVQALGYRDNIWKINNGYGYTTKDKFAYEHPAMFPEQLAGDHIKTWSNTGDVILDPMAGSGTTLKQAKLLGRDYIGIDISQDYVTLCERRVQ